MVMMITRMMRGIMLRTKKKLTCHTVVMEMMMMMTTMTANVRKLPLL